MRVLLVDDEQGYLDLMRDLLQGIGCTVVTAENGKLARECLEQERIDLIISDVFMPTLDGVRFHSYVRDFTDYHDVPFIFISGYDDEHTRDLISDPEIDYFFSKTAPVEKVLSLVRTLMEPKTPGA